MENRRDLLAPLAPLAPLLGEWVADAETPIGQAQCARSFTPALGGAYVELVARWDFGPGHNAYEERALFGASAAGALAFWSFTSDGGQATGEIADVSDIHPSALGFVAAMPAGLARQAYWPATDGSLQWVVEAKTPRGWERLASHCYRRSATTSLL
ncbi:MAG TPA: hypothetical protein VHV78_14310 [Gemmatimonadaceae bacterium]|nr:hypothetical protein [Gemmatimonadaceae bacterium]